MPRLLLTLLVSFVPLAVLYPFESAHAKFFISSKGESCAYSDYSYQIGPDVLFADLSVQSGPDVLFADVTIKLVSSPENADLIFIDHQLIKYQSKKLVDMTICKAMFADKSVQIGPDVLFADIRVQVGSNVMFPDYRLFHDSENFSVNEAAGMFPAIWRLNEKN